MQTGGDFVPVWTEGRVETCSKLQRKQPIKEKYICSRAFGDQRSATDTSEHKKGDYSSSTGTSSSYSPSSSAPQYKQLVMDRDDPHSVLVLLVLGNEMLQVRLSLSELVADTLLDSSRVTQERDSHLETPRSNAARTLLATR